MSDSSVKAGVEDVLSSIKRLVSEEGRKIIGERRHSAPEKPARLVLTDALRVAELTESERNESLRTLARDFSVDSFWMNEPEFSPGQAANEEPNPMVLQASDRVFPEAKEREPKTEERVAVDPKHQKAALARAPGDLAGSLSAKIEALEAAIARTEDQWEPDGNSNDEYAGTRTRRITWDHGSEFAVVDESSRQENDESATAGGLEQAAMATTATFVRADRGAVEWPSEHEPTGEPMAAAGLNEDELRALVTEIVQQELQGALGERITRNIRKLVRREINRALTAQNLD